MEQSSIGPFDIDAAFARELRSKLLLVGFTQLDADGQPLDKVQLYGMVEAASENDTAVRIEGSTRRGELVPLPPVWRAFAAADPGEYRLRSTGEVVINPDFTTTWTVERPEAD